MPTRGPFFAAIPGQLQSADVEVIYSCLANAANAKTDPDYCIGHVMNTCAKDASTTSAKKACSGRELLVWNFELHRDYLKLEKLVAGDRAKQWLRDAKREFFAAMGKNARSSESHTIRQMLWSPRLAEM